MFEVHIGGLSDRMNQTLGDLDIILDISGFVYRAAVIFFYSKGLVRKAKKIHLENVWKCTLHHLKPGNFKQEQFNICNFLLGIFNKNLAHADGGPHSPSAHT